MGDRDLLKIESQEVLMTYMICRNRVKNYEKWKAVFDSHQEAHKESGLKLVKIWRKVEDENNVFFLLEVENIEKAQEFINNPESAEAGKVSGVMDGEYHFVEEAGGN
jgi:hypothetical protein